MFLYLENAGCVANHEFNSIVEFIDIALIPQVICSQLLNNENKNKR